MLRSSGNQPAMLEPGRDRARMPSPSTATIPRQPSYFTSATTPDPVRCAPVCASIGSGSRATVPSSSANPLPSKSEMRTPGR